MTLRQLTEAEMDMALDLRFQGNDFDEPTTIREYLSMVVSELLANPEGFNGKRPFGNSGWKHGFIAPLIMAGCISGRVDLPTEDDPYHDVSDYQIRDVTQALDQIVDYLFGTISDTSIV